MLFSRTRPRQLFFLIHFHRVLLNSTSLPPHPPRLMPAPSHLVFKMGVEPNPGRPWPWPAQELCQQHLLSRPGLPGPPSPQHRCGWARRAAGAGSDQPGGCCSASRRAACCPGCSGGSRCLGPAPTSGECFTSGMASRGLTHGSSVRTSRALPGLSSHLVDCYVPLPRSPPWVPREDREDSSGQCVLSTTLTADPCGDTLDPRHRECSPAPANLRKVHLHLI